MYSNFCFWSLFCKNWTQSKMFESEMCRGVMNTALVTIGKVCKNIYKMDCILFRLSPGRCSLPPCTFRFRTFCSGSNSCSESLLSSNPMAAPENIQVKTLIFKNEIFRFKFMFLVLFFCPQKTKFRGWYCAKPVKLTPQI